MKAVYQGKIIAESDKAFNIEGYYYFPPESVNKELFSESDYKYQCHWKGQADFYNLEINDEKLENIAWSYNKPSDLAKQIAGHYAFYPPVEILE